MKTPSPRATLGILTIGLFFCSTAEATPQGGHDEHFPRHKTIPWTRH
jgi:hypothetical protein